MVQELQDSVWADDFGPADADCIVQAATIKFLEPDIGSPAIARSPRARGAYSGRNFVSLPIKTVACGILAGVGTEERLVIVSVSEANLVHHCGIRCKGPVSRNRLGPRMLCADPV